MNITLKFVPKGQINNIPALRQIMAWRQPGDKPLSEPMMFSLLMHMNKSASISWIIDDLKYVFTDQMIYGTCRNQWPHDNF